MDNVLEKSTCVGLGYASRADAFQSGREAAQIAKGHLPEGPLDLVLAFGPGSIHFKDFVEGVRLVTGEENLVGIPTPRVLTGNQAPAESYAVLIIQSASYRYSIATTTDDKPHSASTSIMTQFRRARGNVRDQFENHGVLVFESQASPKDALVHHIAAEAGLESWMIALSTRCEKNSPIICRNNAILSGAVAIEFLSRDAVGVGTVNVHSFMNQPDIVHNGVKTALRDAFAQLGQAEVACGLLLIDLPMDRISEKDIHGIFEDASAIAKDMPLVGLLTRHQSIRVPGRSLLSQKNSIAVLLVPR